MIKKLLSPIALVLLITGFVSGQTFTVSGENTSLQDLDAGDGFDFETEYDGPWTATFFVPEQSELTFVSNTQVSGGSRTTYSGVVLSSFVIAAASGDFSLVTSDITGEIILWDAAIVESHVVIMVFEVGDSEICIEFVANDIIGHAAFGQMFNVNTPNSNTLDDDFLPTFETAAEEDFLYNTRVGVDAFPPEFGGRGQYHGVICTFENVSGRTFTVSGERNFLLDLDDNDGFDFISEYDGPWTANFFVPEQSELTFVSNIQAGGSRTTYSGVVLSSFVIAAASGDFSLVTSDITGEIILWDFAFVESHNVEMVFEVGDSEICIQFVASDIFGHAAFGQMFNVNTPNPNTLDDDFLPTFETAAERDFLYSTTSRVEVDAFPAEFGGRGEYNGNICSFENDSMQPFSVSGQSLFLEDLDETDGFDFTDFAGTWTATFLVPKNYGLELISNSQSEGGSLTTYSGVTLSSLVISSSLGELQLVSSNVSGEIVLWDRASFLSGTEIVQLQFQVGDSSVDIVFGAVTNEGDLAIGQMFIINTPNPNTLDHDFIPTFGTPKEAGILYTNPAMIIDAFPAEFGGRGVYGGLVCSLEDDSAVTLGDVNMDGVVNLLDVAPFVALLVAGEFQAEADINEDGVVDLLDVSPFIDLLTG